MSDFLVHFIAGGVAGAVAKTCTAPIERVKILLQTQDANPKIISGQVARYTGIADCFTRVASEQGMKAFWRGNATSIIRGYFPAQAFTFALRDSINEALWFPYCYADGENAEMRKFLVIANMASGALAGAGTLSIIYPLDYARTRLASDVGRGKPQFNGLFDCIKTTVASGGIGSLYNGIGISIVGSFLQRGVNFGLFDALAVHYNPFRNDESSVKRIGSQFMFAQVSTISVGYAFYPFDTLRRRLQMQSARPELERIYNGTMDCFSKIIRYEGPTALFKGAGANVLRNIGAASVLVLYSEFTLAFASQ